MEELYTILIQIEDKRFYSHWGIDPKAILRALVINLKHRRYMQGGSTITQQLARTLYLNTKKTLGRKLIEALIAIYLECKYTKKQILDMYGKYVFLGKNVRGFSQAAKTYYNKTPSQLTRQEKISIIAMLPNPIKYSQDKQALKTRINKINKLLNNNHFIHQKPKS